MLYSPLEQFEILYIFMPNTTCFTLSDKTFTESDIFLYFETLLNQAFLIIQEDFDKNFLDDFLQSTSEVQPPLPLADYDMLLESSINPLNVLIFSDFLFDHFFFDNLSKVFDLNEFLKMTNALAAYGEHFVDNPEKATIFSVVFNLPPYTAFFDLDWGIWSLLDQFYDEFNNDFTAVTIYNEQVSNNTFAVLISFLFLILVIEDRALFETGGWNNELSYDDNLVLLCDSIFFEGEENKGIFALLFFIMLLADVKSFDEMLNNCIHWPYDFLMDPDSLEEEDYGIPVTDNTTCSSESGQECSINDNDLQKCSSVEGSFISSDRANLFFASVDDTLLLYNNSVETIELLGLEPFFDNKVKQDDVSIIELTDVWNYNTVQDLNLFFSEVLNNGVCSSDLELSLVQSNNFFKTLSTSLELLKLSFSMEYFHYSIGGLLFYIKLMVLSVVHPFLILFSFISTNLFITIILLFFLIILMFLVFSFQFFLIPRNAHLFMLYYYSFIKSIIVDLIAHQVGKKYYFQLIAFLFIILNLLNLYGLVPYTFVLTSQFSFTFFCSFIFFTALNFTGITVHGLSLFSLFFPSGAPIFISPLLVVIEFISYFARVFSLAIRLFANITAGHILLKILSWFTWSMMDIIFASILSTLIITVLWVLEFFISVLQAYVFTILICIYLNDVLNLH